MKIRRMIAGGAVALLAAGGLALAVAAPAAAHTGDLNVTAVCNEATGQYDLTATLNIAQTGLAGETMWRVGTGNFQGTPGSADGMDRGPVSSNGAGTITLGSWSLPGTTTGKGPWVYAHTTWSDGFKKGSDGQLYENLGGDCEPPVVVPPKPDDKITVTTTDNPWECTDAEVTQTVTTTTITTVLVDNVWVEQEPVVTTSTTTRPFTPEEAAANEEACYVPPQPANPTAVITAVCGAADVTLTNPLIEDANQLTASFVVNVDGEFYGAYSVEAGNNEVVSLTFDEDSGDRVIEVYQAGTSDWKLIADATVTSDCIEPPVVVPPTEEPPVVQPPAPKPPVTAAATTETLAQTGMTFDLGTWLSIGAALIAAAGAVAGLGHLARRR